MPDNDTPIMPEHEVPPMPEHETTPDGLKVQPDSAEKTVEPGIPPATLATLEDLRALQERFNLAFEDLAGQLARVTEQWSESVRAACSELVNEVLPARVDALLKQTGGGVPVAMGLRIFVKAHITTPAHPEGFRALAVVVKDHGDGTADVVAFVDGKAEQIPHWPSSIFCPRVPVINLVEDEKPATT